MANEVTRDGQFPRQVQVFERDEGKRAIAVTPVGSENQITDVIDVVPTLTAGAYSAGDVLFATKEIPIAANYLGGKLIISSLVVNDRDDQGVEMDILILRSNVSIGALNDAASVSANNCTEVLGIINVDEYTDLVASKVATKSGIALVVEAAAGSKSLYIAGITRGTPTHTASGLVIKLGVLKD